MQPPITTVIAPATATPPAGAYDLTDLATVRDELGITKPTDTTNDTWLGRAITQSSAAISNFCNRVFQVEGVQDLFYLSTDPFAFGIPSNVWPLQLSRWPVVSVSSVVENAASANPATLVQGTDYLLDATRGWLTRLSGAGLPRRWTADSVTVQYRAGYTALISREAQSVPAGPGPYTVTVAKASAFALDDGVVYASTGAALVAVAGNPAVGQYSVSAAGVYTLNAADASTAMLFSYFFASIPADLVDATLRLVTGRFKGKGRDPMLKAQDQPALGRQEYWIGVPAGQYGALTPEVVDMVDNYRVPTT